MIRFSILVVCALCLSSMSIAAPEEIDPTVTNEFSPDQVAVYSFILKTYRKLLKPTYRDMLMKGFYLEDETDPLDLEKMELRRGVLQGIDCERTSREKRSIVHRLLGQKWLPSYVKSASGVKCVDSAPSESKICWRTEGALAVTEIQFDKSRQYALVGFSIGCGMQCGWGQVLLLKKVDGQWRRKAVCAEWYI